MRKNSKKEWIKNNEIKILVYYISVAGIRSEDIERYMKMVSERIKANSVSNKTEIIFIPVQSETRIECINPTYITDGDLIKKHERLMAELHEYLNDELERHGKNEG